VARPADRLSADDEKAVAMAGRACKHPPVRTNAREETMARVQRGAKQWALVFAMIAYPISAPAQNLAPVSVIVFPGGFNWPIWVAQEKGYFARGGIEVQLTPTPNSVFQLTNLIEGKFDIGMTAFDNVVAYMEGQGEAPVSVQPDLVAFMGGDNGFLSLTAVPEVKTFSDLKGKTVSVDAATTGYAFVLFDLLKKNGLAAGDYTVEKAGGVVQRWRALQDKKQAGTMLITPFDLMAKDAGYTVLQYAIDVYGNYQGLVGATRRSWAAENAPKLQSYISGLVAGIDWLRDHRNKEEALAILRKNLQQMSAQLAEQSYEVMTGAKGFTPKAQFDVAGARKVLELRSEYAQPKKDLRDPLRYYDPKYYEAALR
jgi:ABC-type nitrate/sulfonate/bicarbonate transport system substrate-binding protein